MTLAELAFLVGVEPKWVLNTLTALDHSPRYSLALARRLAVTHAIVEANGAPVPYAFELARQALRRPVTDEPVVVPGLHDDVGVWIDLPRILSSFNVRLSVLRTTFGPRQRGRPPRKRNALQAASDWGIDLTLLTDNARKSKEQRLRQLDAMVRFARESQRASARG